MGRKKREVREKKSKDMVILLPFLYRELIFLFLCSVQTMSVVAEEQDNFICTRWSCVALTEYR